MCNINSFDLQSTLCRLDEMNNLNTLKKLQIASFHFKYNQLHLRDFKMVKSPMMLYLLKDFFFFFILKL